ncbi:MAG: hypothetical protein IJI08_04535, partial [Clostridia bacterium]|nr:hypothetical protein [Clostridia bacterium]
RTHAGISSRLIFLIKICIPPPARPMILLDHFRMDGCFHPNSFTNPQERFLQNRLSEKTLFVHGTDAGDCGNWVAETDCFFRGDMLKCSKIKRPEINEQKPERKG